MTGNIKNYYAEGNTALGFHSLYESNFQGLHSLFILDGGLMAEKSSLMKNIGNTWSSKGYAIEFLHSSSDNSSINAVIIPKLKVGIVDSSKAKDVDFMVETVAKEYVDFDLACDKHKLDQLKENGSKIDKVINNALQCAYFNFAEALKIHDEWEKIYIENMNFSQLNVLTEELIKTFFENKSTCKKPIVKDRFFGAATPDGPVDFIQNLTEDIPKRYFVKGRPGTGKSTMLKILASEAMQRGFDVEIYHCGFDPNSIDMVAVRELNFVIFDSTSPHEYFPSRDSDEIVDVYKRAVTPGTDEKYEKELEAIVTRYKIKVAEATSYLCEAKKLQDTINKLYSHSINGIKVTEIEEFISSEIEEIME